MQPHYDTLIVGAGQGGVQVATDLTKVGYRGSIGLLSAETVLPYERPPLSKGYLTGEERQQDFQFRTEGYWQKSRVDLLLGSPVESLTDKKEVMLTDGTVIGYENLVWAAGGRARRLPIPGADLDGVSTIRNIADIDQLKRRAGTASSAVIIGGGYIGLETAAAFRKLGLRVTVLEVLERLLARVTSPVVSDFYLREHRAHGVDVRLESGVSELRGHHGALQEVVLADGSVLPAQIAVIGVGIQPNIEPLERAGASCGNGVEVDEFCRTSLTNVYAIGDCASHANPYAVSPRVRLESVQNAVEQARVVVSDIIGAPHPYAAAPWFWSNQYDVKLKTVGVLTGYDLAVTRGDPDSDSFSVAYLKDGTLLAIDCINAFRDFAQARALVEDRAAVDPAALADATNPIRNSATVTAA